MSGWEQRILGGGTQQFQAPVQQQPQMQHNGIQFANPVQKMNFIRQAMVNPAAFVKQYLPGIPEQAFQDPTGNAVLQYMVNNMGVTQADIQNARSQMPMF